MEFLSGIDWSQPSWDLFIVIFFIVASIVYGLSLGRDRLIVMIVSVYMAMAIASTAPFMSEDLAASAGLSDAYLFQVIGFVGVFLLLFFFISRSALQHAISLRAYGGNWWQAMLFSVLQVGLLVSTVVSFLPPEALDHLSGTTRHVFAGEQAQFAWITAPVAAMFLVGRLRKHEDGD